jgi:hypothetical protein
MSDSQQQIQSTLLTIFQNSVKEVEHFLLNPEGELPPHILISSSNDFLKRIQLEDGFLSCGDIPCSMCSSRKHTSNSMCGLLADAISHWLQSKGPQATSLHLLPLNSPISREICDPLIDHLVRATSEQQLLHPGDLFPLCDALGEDGISFLIGMRRTCGTVSNTPPDWR